MKIKIVLSYHTILQNKNIDYFIKLQKCEVHMKMKIEWHYKFKI